jgi:DNA polymerase (family X)
MIPNPELAALFTELADIMELAGENFFKIKAYRQAATAIEHSGDNITELPSEMLLAMPGIGKAIAEKIAAARTSGTFPTLEKWRVTGFATFLTLSQKSPLLTIKIIRKLIKELKLKSFFDLKTAINNGKIDQIESIDQKTKMKIKELCE